MPWMITGTEGSNSELSMALAMKVERSQREGHSAVEVGLDGDSEAGPVEDFCRLIEVASDQARDQRHAQLRHVRGGLHQEPGEFRQVRDAGEDVHQHDAHAWPIRYP